MRKVLAALTAAGLLAAAGCGGGGGGGDTLSKEEYQASVVEVGMVLESAFEEIAEEANSVGSDIGSLDEAGEALEALATSVRDGADALAQAADDLEGLEPPEEAAEANAELADGLRTLSEDIGELADALDEGDLSEILALGNQLQEIATSEAGEQIEGAIEDLKSLGYDVEGDDSEG